MSNAEIVSPKADSLLPFTAEIAQQTQHIYDRVAHIIPSIEWPVFAPYIQAINELKAERNAVILAHNYQTPEIFHCVADIVGDSLQLAIEASRVEAPVIVQCGVHFMAETSKILSPEKTVLLPDLRAGCSLAASITGADIVRLRAEYPGVPVVTYVNTSAEVKANSDICCTSSNVVEVVESFGVDRVLLLPDEYLAKNVAAQTDVEIISWTGRCEVHERFTPEEIAGYRSAHPDIVVLAHPECPPEVVAKADFAGSTAAMAKFVRDEQPRKVVMITECSMSDNVAAENPNVEFIRPCNLCPHMKRISLQGILRSLQTMTHEITVEPVLAARARLSLERMVELNNQPRTVGPKTAKVAAHAVN